MSIDDLYRSKLCLVLKGEDNKYHANFAMIKKGQMDEAGNIIRNEILLTFHPEEMAPKEAFDRIEQMKQSGTLDVQAFLAEGWAQCFDPQKLELYEQLVKLPGVAVPDINEDPKTTKGALASSMTAEELYCKALFSISYPYSDAFKTAEANTIGVMKEYVNPFVPVSMHNPAFKTKNIFVVEGDNRDLHKLVKHGYGGYNTYDVDNTANFSGGFGTFFQTRGLPISQPWSEDFKQNEASYYIMEMGKSMAHETRHYLVGVENAIAGIDTGNNPQKPHNTAEYIEAVKHDDPVVKQYFADAFKAIKSWKDTGEAPDSPFVRHLLFNARKKGSPMNPDIALSTAKYLLNCVAVTVSPFIDMRTDALKEHLEGESLNEIEFYSKAYKSTGDHINEVPARIEELSRVLPSCYIDDMFPSTSKVTASGAEAVTNAFAPSLNNPALLTGMGVLIPFDKKGNRSR